MSELAEFSISRPIRSRVSEPGIFVYRRQDDSKNLDILGGFLCVGYSISETKRGACSCAGETTTGDRIGHIVAYVTDHPVKELWAEYQAVCPLCETQIRRATQDLASISLLNHLLQLHARFEMAEYIEDSATIQVVLPEPEPEPEPFTL